MESPGKFQVHMQCMTNTGVVFYAIVSVEAKDQVDAITGAIGVATKKGLQLSLMAGAPAVPCLAVSAIPLFVDNPGSVNPPDKPQSKIHLA